MTNDRDITFHWQLLSANPIVQNLNLSWQCQPGGRVATYQGQPVPGSTSAKVSRYLQDYFTSTAWLRDSWKGTKIIHVLEMFFLINMIDISSQTARGTVSKNIVKKYSSFISHLDHGWSPPSCPWQPQEAAVVILGGPEARSQWVGLVS